MRPSQGVALLRSLGILPAKDSKPNEKSPNPDFDGGAREPAIETDPLRDHDELALDAAQRAKWGLGPRDR